jgi:hypothetical protein
MESLKGLLTQTAKPIGYQHEAQEAQEHRVKFLKAREDAPVALQAPEQTLDFVVGVVSLNAFSIPSSLAAGNMALIHFTRASNC